jgi:hypothetical protein
VALRRAAMMGESKKEQTRSVCDRYGGVRGAAMMGERKKEQTRSVCDIK